MAFLIYQLIISFIMKGRVAVITASSTGIGKGIAIRLAQEGVKVIISSRNQKHIDAAVA